MIAEDQQALKDLIDGNEGQACRILFTDGQEFELASVGWWQDIGEGPHGHAIVSKVISSERSWKPDSAMSFCFDEIERITYPGSSQTIFQSQ